MTAARILLTGGGGFVGGAVLRRFAELDPHAGARLRLLQRARPVAAPPGAEVVAGDLTDPRSLRGSCDGVDVVVHLAAEVGSSVERCHAVNAAGTANLLAEAERAGVREVLYLSTAAVHGIGPHRDVPETAAPAPVSPASRSRFQAEQAVRAAGGAVLRPFFVYGEGDRWYVPALLRWLSRRPPVVFSRGRARHSVVAVEDLARVVVAVADRMADLPPDRVFHVCEPDPVTVGEVNAELVTRYAPAVRPVSIPGGFARTVLRGTRGLRRLGRQVELLSVDHVYAADRIWRLAGGRPAAPMLQRLDRYDAWYRGCAEQAFRKG